MMLVPLTKKDSQSAEIKTTPILNIVYFDKTVKNSKKLQEHILNMFNWTHKFQTTKERKEHMKTKLGNPLYHAQYEYREAVWGFRYNTIDVICYYSTKGFSIQLSQHCSCDDAIILKELCNQLESR